MLFSSPIFQPGLNACFFNVCLHLSNVWISLNSQTVLRVRVRKRSEDVCGVWPWPLGNVRGRALQHLRCMIIKTMKIGDTNEPLMCSWSGHTLLDFHHFQTYQSENHINSFLHLGFYGVIPMTLTWFLFSHLRAQKYVNYEMWTNHSSELIRGFCASLSFLVSDSVHSNSGCTAMIVPDTTKEFVDFEPKKTYSRAMTLFIFST